MWYVVKCRSDADAHEMCAVLAGEGVVAQATHVTLPFTPMFPVVGFPEEDRELALAALGRHDGPTTATRNPNTRLILTDPVTAVLQRGDAEDLILGVFGLYAADLPEQATLVTCPHGVGCLPTEEEGVLHVRIYSAPVVKSLPRVVSGAYGRVLPFGVRDGVTASSIGSPIASREGPVAEFVGRNLYVHFDASHPGADPEASCEVLAQILEAYIERVGDVRDDLEFRYIQAAERRRGLRLLRARKCREVATADLSKADRARELARIGLDRAQVALHEVESSRASGPERVRDEFKALCRLPHVRDVRIEGGVLIILTDDDILIQSGGQSYPMGPFRIEMPLWARGRIRVISASPRTVGSQVFHTPHVFGDGAPCLGGFGPGVSRFVDEHEWGLAVQLLLSYLHKVNPSETRAVDVLTKCWTPLPAPRPCRCQEVQAMKEEQ